MFFIKIMMYQAIVQTIKQGVSRNLRRAQIVPTTNHTRKIPKVLSKGKLIEIDHFQPLSARTIS